MTGSVFLFGENREFFPGASERTQDPLWFAQGHAMYTFRPGLWAGISSGYGFGGQNRIDGIPRGGESQARYFAMSFGVPINRAQGLKFSFISSRTNTFTGSDLDSLTVAWTLMLTQSGK